ncbi:MAG: methylmalonyl-CoA decarboxylase [Deltaproteobacteria bacterium]|nr:methylmalonyl-CoA decarboxylase [Deltaproteobacteria bacterium]
MTLTISEMRDRVGTITLAHDDKRNALSSALIDELIADLDGFAARKVRAVVLRAKPGASVWSAGHDVSELPRSGRDPLAYSDPLERAVRGVRHFPAPVIAMIEGSVWGGAVELALSCDILIGTPTASFAITPAKIGVPYNPAGILRLMTAVDAGLLVKEMFFTARPIAAERALQVGMLNHVVPGATIEEFTYEMAHHVCTLAPLSIAVIKEQIRLLAEAHPLSPETFERIQGLRRIVYDSDDYAEGISAFLEKRKPQYRGE